MDRFTVSTDPASLDVPLHARHRRCTWPVRAVRLHGADGVASTMLYLHLRNGMLETLRTQIARYLRVGQDERLHASLQRQLERCIEPGEATSLETAL
jgi:hypothetical protein